MNEEGSVEEESFRKLQPVYTLISQLILKFTPKQKIQRLSKRLEATGLLKNNSVEKWLYKTDMMMLIISVFIGLLAYLIEPNLAKALFISGTMMLMIQYVMRFYISRRINQRKFNITRALPYTLDLITVSVEAGLSFDGAIARVIGNVPGELSDEFAKTLKETKMGIERRSALRNMSDRCDIKELSMLITSLIQADSLGVSLSHVLRIEAAGLREHRKQLAREKAMKAPVKMLFPLILFIFPAIFVIILGPAVVKVVQIFGR